MFCLKSQYASTDIFPVPMNKEEVRYRLVLSLIILRKGMQNKGRVELVKHNLSDNCSKSGLRLQFGDIYAEFYTMKGILCFQMSNRGTDLGHELGKSAQADVHRHP